MAQRLFADNLPADLLAVMTTTEDGDMRNQANVDRVCLPWFGKPERYLCQQVHQDKVVWSEDAESGKPVVGVDGLVSTDNTALLTIRTADCLPLFIWERLGGACGLLHAGWRGVASNILASAVRNLAEKNIGIDYLSLGIGPAICQGCFEVDSELNNNFASYPEAIIAGKPSKSHIDLKRVVYQQWTALGGRTERLVDCACCTRCDRRYYSYRRDQDAGRMLAMLGKRGTADV